MWPLVDVLAWKETIGKLEIMALTMFTNNTEDMELLRSPNIPIETRIIEVEVIETATNAAEGLLTRIMEMIIAVTTVTTMGPEIAVGVLAGVACPRWMGVGCPC